MKHSQILIRPEQTSDQAAIYDLTKRAFAPMPYAGGNEQDLVDALRAGQALTLSLVAVEGDAIIGHIAFSPATAGDRTPNWYALGPVSVEPRRQRSGIGSALINDGLLRLKSMEAAGCILTGNPTYYKRFGFTPYPHLAPAEEPAEYFMILPLATKVPSSVMAFHPIFYS